MSTGGDSSLTERPERLHRIPLQIGISSVFILLISLFGLVLVWYQYEENKEMDLLAAQDLFERITRETTANIRELYAPAEALVDISTRLAAAESASAEERQGLLPYFTESLRHAEHIASIYVGYESGELFLVRALRKDRTLRSQLGAPARAEFQERTITVEPGGARETTRFYDEQLRPLGPARATETDFDPRTRIWYQKAIDSERQISSGFYRFASTGETGTTIARRTPRGRAVVAADLTLRELSVGIAAQRVTPSSEILVFNSEGAVLAYGADAAPQPASPADPEAELRQTQMTELDHPVLDSLYERYQEGMTDGQLALTVDSQSWLGAVARLPVASGAEVFLAILAPQDELLAGVLDLRTRSLLISLGMLALAIVAAWLLSRRIAKPLLLLAGEAEQIRELKLDGPITLRSRLLEVDQLARTLGLMKASIQHFIEISKALSAEKNFDRLLESILTEARTVGRADAGTIMLFDDERRRIDFNLMINQRTGTRLGGTSGRRPDLESLSLDEAPDGLPEKQVIESGRAIEVSDLAAEPGLDYSCLRERYAEDGFACRSLLLLPLRNRQDDVIGALELVNARDPETDEVVGFSPEAISYVRSMSSQAAIALDNRRLLQAQKDLLDALIQLIAGAIDAKSPYTSGHCQRVPELARMLAEAAHGSEAAPFRAFRLDDDERYELHIASWLHDCGKVTTPEHVVDKATKLECLYNRIHEIRTRFEVLWRDAEIEYLRAAVEPDADRDALDRALQARRTELRDDWAFVATTNQGGEFMADADLERLGRIGARTWQRHFDDRVGLSEDELRRKQAAPSSPLPAQESLLADKPEHLIPRPEGRDPFGANRQGFRMEVPEHAANLGELTNLGIRRGTLTDEDRFKINEHIVQTILMLDKLPFPKELRRVPTWAGNHHEKLDGTGYPRRLGAEQLSIPERVMAIADIFEALTAADRPYKKSKTLSESLRIMSYMRDDGHICPDLFELFLRTGVYQEYAQRFLRPEQIDAVEIGDYLAERG